MGDQQKCNKVKSCHFVVICGQIDHAKQYPPAQYVLILIDLAEQAGCGREQLLAGTALASTGLERIGARVEDREFTRLALNALELTGQPDLGLQLGMRLNLGAHAVLGQAFMTCNNLAEVIDLFLNTTTCSIQPGSLFW
ncbi:MAG: AraC family transcriptional regulator ligand-binding domain-containing protein [Pseudohongiellaceae bacterium]